MMSQKPPGGGKIPAVLAAIFLAAGARQTYAQQEYCRTSRGLMGNGYHYEMWIQDGTEGSACMTVQGTEARFRTAWNLGGYGFVARVGLVFDQTRTADQIGWISSDFQHLKSGTGTVWIGVYGWTVDPLMEYYILEDWIGWRPQYTRKGTITMDGGEYDVYTNTRVQQPSIQGTRTFEQWYSVRRTPRQSGRISISGHFAEWKALGMPTGKLYEAKLKVEGLSGSGTVDFTKATVTVGSKPNTSVMPVLRTSRERGAIFGEGAGRGGLSLVSLTGAVVGSVRVDGQGPAPVPAGAPAAGMYFLRPAGNGKSPAAD